MFDAGAAAELLEKAADWERRKAHCDAARFSALADYAELHTSVDPEVAAGPGAARLVRVGGDGTPAVDEFCLCELAASAHLQEDTARRQLAVALDLRYRLPGVQAALAAGRIPGWRARLVADATRALSLEQARLDETRLLPVLTGLGARRLGEIVTLVLIDTDPDAAEGRAEGARKRRHVTLDPRHEQEHGLISGAFTADAADALRFHRALDAVAGRLADLGDTDPAHVRRARALGHLANPHQALALMQRATADPAGGHVPASGVPGRPWPEATLYVHFTRDQWNRERSGAAVLDGVGPITLAQARHLLGNANVIVKPVIDLDHADTSDARFARGRLREAVVLKTTHCPFPYCTRPARHNEIDHTAPVAPRQDRHRQPVPSRRQAPPRQDPRGMAAAAAVQRHLRVEVPARPRLPRRQPRRHPRRGRSRQRASGGRAIGTCGMPSSRNSGPVTVNPHRAYQSVR